MSSNEPFSLRLGQQSEIVKLGMKITGLKKPEFVKQSIELGAPLLIQAFRKLRANTPKP